MVILHKKSIAWREKLSVLNGIVERGTVDTKKDMLEFDNGESFFMEVAPGFWAALDEFLDLNKNVDSVNNLNSQQLRFLNDLLTQIKHSVEYANNLIDDANKRPVREQANKFITDVDETGKDRDAKRNIADKFLNVELIDSVRYGDELGEGGKEVVGWLRKGLNTKIWDIDASKRYIEKTNEAKRRKGF